MKLVFLHIRKSAGSSMRRAFENIFGANHVHWNHIKLKRSDFNSNKTVLGGHLNYRDIDNISPESVLYVSCVRHPITRVISLFHYHRTKDVWSADIGFDGNSLYNTIVNCKQFRDLINNNQCFTLSGKRTFSGVLEAIHRDNFIIGTQENIDQFITKLSSKLCLDLDVPKDNVAKGNVKQGAEITDELFELVYSLNSEDFILYEFIKSKGVLETANKEIDIKKLHVSQSFKIMDITYGDGWYSQELNGRWCEGNESVITIKHDLLSMFEGSSPIELCLSFQGHYFKGAKKNTKVYMNSCYIGEFDLSSLTLSVEERFVDPSGFITITLLNYTGVAPKLVDDSSNDLRPLNYNLKGIYIEQV